MTEIDVPDWVVQLAVDEMTRVPPESEGQWFSRDIEEVMRACITAALGALVVPGPYRFLKNGDNPSDWLDRQINGEPPNPKHLREEFRIENAYTLRQEKPE